MAGQPIPTIILGGSDRRPVRLPADVHDKHPLSGYKGVDLKIGGRPVVEILVERLEAAGAFDPIYLAGPAHVYRDCKTRAIPLDTNSSFGGNIATAFREVLARHPGSPIAFTTCDILPETPDLVATMADWNRRAPCDLWFPLIRAPQDRRLLGASAWKPIYRVLPERGQAPVDVLPGHLIVTDPQALRLKFIHSLLDAGFRTRNRPVLYRLATMAGRLLAGILFQDVLHLAGGRLPTLTWDTVGTTTVASVKLHRGLATLQDLENATRSLFIKRRHRVRFPERRVSLPVLDGLSLALDIDTEEEAQEKERPRGATA